LPLFISTLQVFATLRGRFAHELTGGFQVANHKSAEKRMRQSDRRRLRNRIVRSQVKTAKKKILTVIDGGDAEAIKTQLGATMSQLQKAATKGVMKKKTVSRQIGRLAKAAHRQTQANG